MNIQQKLCFTYINDIISAYILTIEFLEKEKSKYEVFNI
jgi:nucleoside-diphosphate-sugar epimerase